MQETSPRPDERDGRGRRAAYLSSFKLLISLGGHELQRQVNWKIEVDRQR